MRALTEKVREQFFREGFTFPIQALSQNEANSFLRACEELEALLGGAPHTIEVRQMHLHFAWAYTLATHPRILDAAEDLLGPNLLIWATELFIKPGQVTSLSIGWHRDRHYMGLAGGKTVTAWIALSDSTPANGCLCVVRDTNRAEAGRASRPRRQEAPDPTEVVDVVLRVGELSFHDPDILHGSGPNHSCQKRVGFVVRFLDPDCRPLHGRPPAVLARGQVPFPHFRLAGPPKETSPEDAVAALRVSADEHLTALLQNLREVRS